MQAKDLMTAPVEVITADTSLEAAATLMLDKGIGCLPVVDSEGRMIGIITESDFAGREQGIPFSLYKYPQVFGEFVPKSGVEKMYEAARTRTVSEFMHRAVASVEETDELETVIKTMQKTGYHRIPVLNNGKPVGIVSRHNLLRLMVNALAKAAQ